MWSRDFKKVSGAKISYYWQLTRVWSWIFLSINHVFEWKKNKEIYRKNPMKICKNSDFCHIRLEKSFLQNSDPVKFWALFTHLCAKNQKKLMLKSRENAKKRFFGIFPAFSAQNLVHFLRCPIRNAFSWLIFLDILWININ